METGQWRAIYRICHLLRIELHRHFLENANVLLIVGGNQESTISLGFKVTACSFCLNLVGYKANVDQIPRTISKGNHHVVPNDKSSVYAEHRIAYSMANVSVPVGLFPPSDHQAKYTTSRQPD